MAATVNEDGVRTQAEAYIAAETEAAFADEVRELLNKGEWEELAERFSGDLEFGTGGLRGVIGGGTNRMNTFVIRRATEGLARYVVANAAPSADGTPIRAVISHDSRRYSRQFALDAACVLCSHGIETWLFPDLRPTPELSYAVRAYGATTGIMVTASHNPPQYNGYKVYWEDGAQIVPPHDRGIIQEVKAVAGAVRPMPVSEAEERGLLRIIPDDFDADFLARVRSQVLRPEVFRGDSVPEVVYTPLHGTGALLVERIFDELGVRYRTVESQREPDGEFPTVKFPNPEEASALEAALDLGRQTGASLVMGTDPDADRLGIAVNDGTDFQLITGNQLGCLMIDYILAAHTELGSLPARPAVVKTIVTTELQRRIAEFYGAEIHDTLTGFKWIASKIREFEMEPNGPTYLMGNEESYGYMIGDWLRDKDGITACVLTAEMAAWYASRGMTLIDRLNELYQQFGVYQEIQISRYFEGSAGKQIMERLMTRLRGSAPSEIGGVAIREIRDFDRSVILSGATGEKVGETTVPRSNVLQYVRTDGAVISARPSGTEPKIKFYASVSSDPGENLSQMQAQVAQRISAIEQDIQAIIQSATNA